MLHEFAITPEVFHPKMLEKYPELKGILGFVLDDMRQYGLIANLHGGEWFRFVGKMVQALRPYPQLQRKLQDDLKYFYDRGRLVLYPQYNKTGELQISDWFNAAEEIAFQSPLRGIIVGPTIYQQHSSCVLPLIDATQAFASTYRQFCTHSIDVKTEMEAYRERLKPLLSHATTLHLIDPYINCAEVDFRSFIDLCCQLLGARRQTQQCSYINIHAGDPCSPDCLESQKPYYRQESLNAWESEFKMLASRYNSRRYEFRVTFWRDFRYNDQQRFHDRYILTNQCGIAVQYGLRLTKGNSTTWHLLSDEVRQARLDDHLASGKYDQLGSITVS